MNNRLNTSLAAPVIEGDARTRAEMQLAALRVQQQRQLNLVLDTTQVPLPSYSPLLAQAAELTGARSLAGGMENRVRLIDVKKSCDQTVAALTKLGFQLTDE